jgi:hypothetical protein
LGAQIPSAVNADATIYKGSGHATRSRNFPASEETEWKQ